jgi:transcriptional regulator with XRE-family HTH domain
VVARRLGVSKTTVLRVVRDDREGCGPRAVVYTPAVLRRMAAERRRGATAPALAAKYGGAVATVLAALRRAGVTHRVRPYLKRRTPAEVRRVLALRRAGLSYRQIADRIGRSRKLVQNVLRDHPPG